MIPLFITQQLTPQTVAINPDGTLANRFYFLIRALLLRTGNTGSVPFTVGHNLVAAGASQATALALVDDYNEVLSGGGGVALAELQPGQTQVVFNGSGGGINVYPNDGGKIDALAIDGAYGLANGKTQAFTCYSISAAGLTQFRTLQLG